MLCLWGKTIVCQYYMVMEELSASVPLRTPTARVKLSDKWPPPLISAGAFTLETYLDKYFDIQGMGDHLSPLPLFRSRSLHLVFLLLDHPLSHTTVSLSEPK